MKKTKNGRNELKFNFISDKVFNMCSLYEENKVILYLIARDKHVLPIFYYTRKIIIQL